MARFAPSPDHLALVGDLLANHAAATCPICGQSGFWDNRTGKKNPKSPDWKCKNKACVGATPMKGKQPYAVWLPDDYEVPELPSRPAIECGGKEYDENGRAIAAGRSDLPPVKSGDVPADEVAQVLAIKRDAIESAYRWAYATAARVQSDSWASFTTSGGDDMIPKPTAESIQAGAATLLIQAEKRSAI